MLLMPVDVPTMVPVTIWAQRIVYEDVGVELYVKALRPGQREGRLVAEGVAVVVEELVVGATTTSNVRKTLSKDIVGAVAGPTRALQAATRMSELAPPVPTIPVWSITMFPEDVMV